MTKLTTPFAVDLLNIQAIRLLVPELTFGDLADIADRGPFVYLLLEPHGGIVYPGKSDATTGAAGKRAMSYAKWDSDYMAAIAASGRPDPIYDPQAGDLDLGLWAPIIRFAARYTLNVKIASVASTGESGSLWEARLKGLAGILTGLESVVGGSGWEFKPVTLRARGYEWAHERIDLVRSQGPELLT